MAPEIDPATGQYVNLSHSPEAPKSEPKPKPAPEQASSSPPPEQQRQAAASSPPPEPPPESPKPKKFPGGVTGGSVVDEVI